MTTNHSEPDTPLRGDAARLKNDLVVVSDRFLDDDLTPRLDRSAERNATFGRRIASLRAELEYIAGTREALNRVLHEGRWFELLEAFNLAETVLKVAEMIEADLIRKVVATVRQGANGAIHIVPEAMDAMTEFGFRSARALHDKSGNFPGEDVSLLEEDGLDIPNPAPLVDFARSTRSVRNTLTAEDIFQTLDRYFQKLVHYLDLAIRGRTKAAAIKVMEVSKIWEELSKRMKAFSERRDTVKNLQRIQKLFFHFRTAIRTLQYFVKKYLQPQSAEFLGELTSLSSRNRMLEVMTELRALQRMKSRFNGSTIGKYFMTDPDPGDVQVAVLESQRRALDQFHRSGQTLPLNGNGLNARRT